MEKDEYEQGNYKKNATVHCCVRLDSRQIDKYDARFAIFSAFHYQLDKLSKNCVILIHFKLTQLCVCVCVYIFPVISFVTREDIRTDIYACRYILLFIFIILLIR